MQHVKMLAALCVVFLMVESCGSSAPKIATRSFAEYTLTADQAKQTKKDVTIEVEVLKPSEMYRYPELFSFNRDLASEGFYNVFVHYPQDEQGKSWCYTFGFGEKYLAACKVKIANNTDHILRMKDARIRLMIPGEEPIEAVMRLGNTVLVQVSKKVVLPKSYMDDASEEGPHSLVYWLTYFEREWERTRKKGLISFPYPVGMGSQVIALNKKNYKLINSVDVEILPALTYTGILFFPVAVSEYETAKLMFYDITTKTDAAGTPIEKMSFEFPLKQEAVTMWYDNRLKVWKKGEPPGEEK